ncbi:MAG: hypothetical protein CM1200mP2_08720 [Planctomycetaceae bacterium]|nr:MAG: hypothetical protein CM1200mP2_08720 [Planctomycetaceae bacterium]
MATRVTVGVTGVLFVLGAFAVDWSDAADRSTSTGAIDSEGLGRMLRSVGVKPRAAGSRYDFEFHSKQGGQEWDFAMSAVISQNGGHDLGDGVAGGNARQGVEGAGSGVAENAVGKRSAGKREVFCLRPTEPAVPDAARRPEPTDHPDKVAGDFRGLWPRG